MSADEGHTPGERTRPDASAPAPHSVESIDVEGLPRDLTLLAIIGEIVKGLIGLLGGLAIIGFGISMIINGVTGEIDLSVHAGENQVDVKTVVVGVVVALIGLAVIAFTAMKVKAGPIGSGTGSKSGKDGHNAATPA